MSGVEIPAGWRLVPEVASEKMCDDATYVKVDTGRGHNTALNYEEAALVWSAMLAAAPQPPAPASTEAMREAAAQIADQEAIDSAILHDASGSHARREREANRVAGAKRIAAAIRALPVNREPAARRLSDGEEG